MTRWWNGLRANGVSLKNFLLVLIYFHLHAHMQQINWSSNAGNISQLKRERLSKVRRICRCCIWYTCRSRSKIPHVYLHNSVNIYSCIIFIFISYKLIFMNFSISPKQNFSLPLLMIKFLLCEHFIYVFFFFYSCFINNEVILLTKHLYLVLISTRIWRIALDSLQDWFREVRRRSAASQIRHVNGFVESGGRCRNGYCGAASPIMNNT